MRRLSAILGLCATVAFACSRPVEIIPTDRPCADPETSAALFGSWVENPGDIPFSFVYDGVVHEGPEGLELLSKSCGPVPSGKNLKAVFRLDKDVELSVDALLNQEFGELEYTVWIENKGSSPSKEIKDFASAVIPFEGEDPMLRGCLGDHGNLYADYQTELRDTVVSFVSSNGRATHIVFPYFDLVHGDGGTLLAIGWAGTWMSEFWSEGSTTIWKAGNCNHFDSVLMPGEKIRSALVVMLPYKGRDRDDATNLWREWFIKYNMPAADARGNRIQPFSTTCFAADTGLPNSDGSISERFYTWKRTLERLVYEDVVPDFRWFDAGWYFDPRGETVPSNWYGTVGTWELDTVKWPGKSFLESNEACHKEGMKVLTWFEPESVCDVEDLARNYGYNPEWADYNRGNRYTSNLGNPDCLEWTLGRITRMMGENGVDLFREDNNSNPVKAWKGFDAKEMEKTGLPRTGITENKAIQGHYELWDRIIDFCAANGKCTFIDNCASGGGRNDIESLRRSLPFMRSDADRTTTALRLSMTTSFNRWIPFHGANTKESTGELDPGIEGGSTFYITRASWLPVYNISEVFTHDVNLDYDRLRATFGEWKKYNHLLVKDIYPLTPWHRHDDDSHWTAIAWHDRETDEAVLQAFRQETCPDSGYVARLKFLKADKKYRLTNEDSGETLSMTGAELASTGIRIVLPEPKSSAVWHAVREEAGR
ncbi:MAG: alpha-galactosidase [Bacteroidales bacterium]|nr:alpha-galactosidase [Bacteroidales bacterium]